MSGFHTGALIDLASGKIAIDMQTKTEEEKFWLKMAMDSIVCLEDAAAGYSLDKANANLDKAIAQHKYYVDKFIRVKAAERYAKQTQNYLPLLRIIGFDKGYEDKHPEAADLFKHPD